MSPVIDTGGQGSTTNTSTALPGGSPSKTQLTQFQGGTASGPGSLSQSGGSLPAQITTSPYEYQAFEGYSVIVGQELATMLDAPKWANTAVTIGKVLTQFESHLSKAQQIQIENQLYHAGFYTTATGTPIDGRAYFGLSSDVNQQAIGNLLVEGFNSNVYTDPKGASVSAVLASAVATGGGYQPPAPQPQTGGGVTEQVTLTSPQDLYQQLYTTFEQTLGRAPQQAELNSFVKLFQGEQSKYQQALNTQQNDMAFQRYQVQQYQRDVQEKWSQTPHLVQGPVPALGTHPSEGAWANAFLKYNALPVTQSNVAFVLNWVNAMGGWGKAQEDHNPLGAQFQESAAQGQVVGPNGPIGQRSNYANWAQGIMDISDALLSQQPAMTNVMDLLASGKPIPSNLAPEILKELSAWSGGAITQLPPSSPGTETMAHAVAAAAAKLAAPGPAGAGGAQPGGQGAPAGTAAPTTATAPAPPTTQGPAQFAAQAPTSIRASVIPQVAPEGTQQAAAGMAAPGPNQTETGADGQSFFSVKNTLSPTGYVWAPGKPPGSKQPAKKEAAAAAPKPGTIEWRATHPATGPGFSTAALPPAQPAPTGPTTIAGRAQAGQAPVGPGFSVAPHNLTSQERSTQAYKQQRAQQAAAAVAAARAKAQQAQQPYQQPVAPKLPAWKPPAYVENGVPPADVVSGQNPYKVGDVFIAPSEYLLTSPPSQQGAAFTQATTGANAPQYEAYQYVNAFNAVADMIATGRVGG